MLKRSDAERTRGGAVRGSELLSLNNVLRTDTEDTPLSIHSSVFIRRIPFSEWSSLSRFALTLGLFLTVFSASAKVPRQPAAPIDETAVIYVTGSTNTRPLTIIVFSNGGAVVNGQGRGLPLSLNHRLFNQLKASMPLTGLPARHGMRSASFGTATYVIFRGEITPDLTLPGNDLAKVLKADVAAIMSGLNGGMIVNIRKR